MKAKITISRGSDDKVRIRIRDDASRVEFVEVALTMEAYGYVLTGLSEQDAELTVRNLQWVGKKRVNERREVVCPIASYDRDFLSAWLKENAKEDGWIVDTYLGSQNSFSRAEGGTLLRYSVIKYEDV